jgi:hypothetical protein
MSIDKAIYSVYCEDELPGLEVNSYYLTQAQALQMANELLSEGNQEVTIVNMSDVINEEN